MEPKKNPQSELKRNSDLYFAIGLTLVILLAYVVLEWKTYHVNDWDTSRLDIADEIMEEVPVTFHKLPPPPPPKIQAPTVIEVKPDDEDVIETIIESNEPTQDTEIIKYEDIDYEEPIIEEKIDWISIEEVPIFPGCENSTDKRVCFQEMMLRHIKKNFRYPESAIETNQQGKVYVQFTVQKDGSISEVRLRGPHITLEREAARIISKLPVMIPGKQRGTPVKVPFSIPIIFMLQ